MAEPIFKTIDFSKQIAEDQARTNAANLAGIQNLANTYVAGRQENINQARQLMSDFDAVINEVDDIHKEGVSEAIAETQKKLANNIYKKKGKNGVRLNLGDLNSKDFNYARDMRKLKNMATNSRLVKQQLTDVKNNIKTDQYILSNADRANAAADVSTYLSSSEALNQSPEELNDQIRNIYRKYRDNVGEAVDIHLSDLKKTSAISVGLDDGGNLITTQTAFYESLYTPNEQGGYDLNEEEVNKVVEKYAQPRADGSPGFILQGDKEAFKSQLIEKARTVQEQKLVKDKLTRDTQKASIASSKALTDKRVAQTAKEIAKLKDDQALDELDTSAFVSVLQNATGEDRRRANFDLQNIFDGAEVGNIKSEEDYVDYYVKKAIQDKSFRDTLTDADENGEGWTEMSPNRQKEFFKEQWAAKKKASADLHILVIKEKDGNIIEEDLSDPAQSTNLDGLIKLQAKSKGGLKYLKPVLAEYEGYTRGVEAGKESAVLNESIPPIPNLVTDSLDFSYANDSIK